MTEDLIESGKYEYTLQAAAHRLQDVLPIGKVKHIGLLEVPAGIDELIQDRKELLEALRELYDYADLSSNYGIEDLPQPFHRRSRAAFGRASELLERLEDAPEPPEEDADSYMLPILAFLLYASCFFDDT